jgi:TRAP-type C4-dicarboxylate transport system permease small subunit
MPRLVERAAALWALAGGAALLAIVAVTLVNAAGFAADRLGARVGGLPGYEDAVRLVISGAALSFFPWCQARRGHVRVDLFAERLPGAARRGLDRVWLALTAALALLLAGTMALGAVETREDGALSRILGWPVWPFYLPGVVSLLLWALVAACQIRAPLDEAGDG